MVENNGLKGIGKEVVAAHPNFCAEIFLDGVRKIMINFSTVVFL
jgi:hypothetical protein